MMPWNGCSRSRGTGAQHPWNAQSRREHARRLMSSPRGSVRARSFAFAVALPAMFEPTAGPGALFTRRSRVPGFSVRATTGPLRFPGDPSRAFALL